MKKLYLNIFALLLFTVSLQKANAQCKCSDGSTPDSVTYANHYDSIISTNTVINFPKFSPTKGVMKCLRLSNTVTTVVSYNLSNDLDYTEEYNFETYRRSQFTGPGGFFSTETSTPRDYGPFVLGPYDPVGTGDEVNIGPDTTFYNHSHDQYFGANSAFYGAGNVSFNYLTTSTFTILTGSDNAIFRLRAYTRLDISLTYFYCPFSVLNNNITNFTAFHKDNNILLQWQVNDPESVDTYEVEVSSDGRTFRNLGEGSSSISGLITKYNFVYNLQRDDVDKLFFRIKQTNHSGKILYSVIRIVSVKKGNSPDYSLYPNPAVSGVNIQFMNNTGGNYEVQLINSTGQIIFEKKYLINPDGSINIEWPQKPKPGIYYLKVKDIKSNLEESSRLQIL